MRVLDEHDRRVSVSARAIDPRLRPIPRALSGANDAGRLSLVVAAPHGHLAEFQRHSNYTHWQVMWAFGSTIRREDKFWPPVGRIDNVYGDKRLACGRFPMDAYSDAAD